MSVSSISAQIEPKEKLKNVVATRARLMNSFTDMLSRIKVRRQLSCTSASGMQEVADAAPWQTCVRILLLNVSHASKAACHTVHHRHGLVSFSCEINLLHSIFFNPVFNYGTGVRYKPIAMVVKIRFLIIL